MKEAFNQQKLFTISFGLISIVGILLCLVLNGTGGGGDSVMHYLYAKYAFTHPQNLLHHWAKPFFTLLASPFSQFGFTGIKIFNILCSLVAVFFSYKTLQKLEIANSGVIALFLASSNLFVSVSFSGLTEPLSAAMLMMSICWVISGKELAGLVLISFMPFVRSEGLIILGVFAIYLVSVKQYKNLLCLLSGHWVYSIAGYPYYKDILWVFTKIPYTKPTNLYGKGSWDHFLIQLNFQSSPVLYALFWIGCLYFLFQLIRRFRGAKNEIHHYKARLWLIYGNFFAFFIAHSAFWALGIFNSIGLVRVFVSVLPLFAIIAIEGLNTIHFIGMNTRIKTSIQAVLVLVIVIMPFLKGPYNHNFPGDFVLNTQQQLIKEEIKPYIEKNYSQHKLVFLDSNIPFLLELDPFSGEKCYWYQELGSPQNLKQKEVLLADPWFTKMEWGYPIETLLADSSLQLITSFPEVATKEEASYLLFAKK